MTASTAPAAANPTQKAAAAPLPLKGVRILSLALNLPGPAALMRCRQMGATCTKLEPLPHPSAAKGTTGDPMGLYNRIAYDVLHQGVKIATADLKSDKGQAALHKALARTDVLLTSFRPSALVKLGLDWKVLHRQYPGLSMVAIVGAPGARAEEPGHDLTYLAENHLVNGLELPPTLYADMGGSLMASEAVLKARLVQLQKGKGVRLEVALSDAAGYLALPRNWGLTTPGAAVGGGHAGYRVYPCKDGRVAVAALEPHFAAALAKEAGLEKSHIMAMFAPETHSAVAAFLTGKTRKELEALASAKDIPLHTLA
jgi:crotonobetainyl-CoA:carnitine CoA-transferase CaiB-like acyl-CoA transferase